MLMFYYHFIKHNLLIYNNISIIRQKELDFLI